MPLIGALGGDKSHVEKMGAGVWCVLVCGSVPVGGVLACECRLVWPRVLACRCVCAHLHAW